jgi:hypothetical protein
VCGDGEEFCSVALDTNTSVAVCGDGEEFCSVALGTNTS